MNIGKTAALVTATAGAVAFGGADATALAPAAPVPPGNGIRQLTPCAGGDCLDFARIFGGGKSVVQKNHCDSSASSSGNVVVVPITGGQCANIAVEGGSMPGANPFGDR
ncbi:hypothetical protein ACH4TX_31030 [Streptomyces sp. NPDC021098]|uniref:hypothetical protein n=1 Tax=unclassified Streptomyces TaxID=2593676 RepID=UPI0037B20F6A